MPIINGIYVAPTWANDAPPSINQIEMNAISDTVASSQRKIGDTILTSRADLGDGYLLCNGEELKQTEYPELYGILKNRSITDDFNINTMVNLSLSDYAISSIDGISKIVYGNGYYVFLVECNRGISATCGRYFIFYTSDITSKNWNVLLFLSQTEKNVYADATLSFQCGYFISSYKVGTYKGRTAYYDAKLTYFSAPSGQKIDSTIILNGSEYSGGISNVLNIDGAWFVFSSNSGLELQCCTSLSQTPTGFTCTTTIMKSFGVSNIAYDGEYLYVIVENTNIVSYNISTKELRVFFSISGISSGSIVYDGEELFCATNNGMVSHSKMGVPSKMRIYDDIHGGTLSKYDNICKIDNYIAMNAYYPGTKTMCTVFFCKSDNSVRYSRLNLCVAAKSYSQVSICDGKNIMVSFPDTVSTNDTNKKYLPNLDASGQFGMVKAT